MSALDEDQQQLLESLMHQADVVAPPSDKTKQPEQNTSLDYNNPDHDLPGILDSFISGEMGGAEAMQFEQQSSASSFVSQQPSQLLQQTPEANPSGPAGSSFQGQGSSGFSGQQTGFTRVATGQASATGFQVQNLGYQQQVQVSQPQPTQMNVGSSEGYQSQSSGFQQQFPVAASMAAGAPIDKSASLSSGFVNQSAGFSQQYSLETASAAPSDSSGQVSSSFQSQNAAYQSQTHPQFTDPPRNLQPQQQQGDGAYTNSLANASKEQVNISSAVYQNQSTDGQQQQFHNEFSTSGGSNNTSLQTIGQAHGFQQQQYQPSGHSQPVSEQRSPCSQQTLQDYTNQVASFQQEAAQHQSMFQQTGQLTANNSSEQTYKSNPTEGSPMCFSDALSGFSQQQQQQQQQGTMGGSAAVDSTGGSQTNSGGGGGGGCGVQHAQYTSASSSQAEPGGMGTFQGQVACYTKQQQSFHSPAGSPGQPTQSVATSPASYPQPSPEYDTHNFPASGQAQVQSDQTEGMNFSGHASGFSKQLSFQSPAPSPDQNPVDGSVPSSPASNYQHQSPGFTAQSPYPPSGQPLGQADPGSGGTAGFPPHAANFSQSLPGQGDQNVVNNFSGTAIFSPNNSIQEDPKAAAGYQQQAALHSHCPSQGESGMQAQAGSFQQPAFPSSAQPQAPDSATQPMQEGSGPSSMEADVVAFLHETLQSVNPQSQAMESNTPASSYPQNPASQTVSVTRRDQPMETQQSPYLVGAGTSTGAFHGQTQASAPQPAFLDTGKQVSQASIGFLNQTLPFQGQSSGFPVSAAVPAQSHPASAGGLMTDVSQNTQFAGDKLGSGVFSHPASEVFNSQTVFSSVQSTGMSFSLTAVPSVVSGGGTASASENKQFSQNAGNRSDFGQFPGSVTAAFGHDSGQQQPQQQQQQQQQQHSHPQFQQPTQQVAQQTVYSSQAQAVQQTVYTSQPQASGVTLMRNNSSHNLSLVNEGLQMTQFQSASSSAPSAVVSQAPSVTVMGNQQHGNMGTGQFQAQLVVASPGQLGMQDLSSVFATLQANSMQNPVSFGQGTALATPSLTTTPGASSTSPGKSASASLQDSNLTNTALSQLTSVLQQIHALLPQAIGKQPNASATPQQTAAVNDGPDVLSKLMQSENNAKQVLQLLQQQNAPAQQSNSQAVQQAQGQGFPVQQSQVNQQENVSVIQQPNFLIQQSNQQSVFPAQHQTPQQALQNIGQQMTAPIPSTIVADLGSHAGSEGQPVRLLVDSRSCPSSVGGGLNVSAAVTMALSTAGLSANASQPVVMGQLPVDLQNVTLNLFSSAAVSSATGTSVIHATDTTPTTAPLTGSNISNTTSVKPTPSFTHPLQVAGVGMGVAAHNSTAESAHAENTAFQGTSSKSQPLAPAPSVSAGDTNSVNIPAVANIFYPVSSANRHEKMMDTSVNVSASVPVGNFLNVTTGSASMLLNAFSMAVADGKSDSSGFKMGAFNIPTSSMSENILGDLAQQSSEARKRDASEMEMGEAVEGTVGSENAMDTDKTFSTLTPRHSSRKTSMEEDLEHNRGDNGSSSVLRKILTMKDEDGNAPNSKAGSPTPESSPVETPEIFIDGNTQSTLIEKSEKLRLSSEAQQEDDMQPEFWTSVPSFVNATLEDFVPTKVHRGADDLDTASKQVSLPSVEKLFDAGGATSNSAFVFTKFGAEDSGVRAFGSSTSETAAPSNNTSEERMAGIISAVKSAEPLKIGTVPTASIRPSARRQKEPGLTFQFPSKVGEYELRIVAQPEEQHRARYLTEGSRGAVKDRSQQGYPIIKLNGYNEPATLQVFIGSETGRVKPHGFYQACKVCGKNSTHCTEREIDGTNVIEIEISPMNDMQVNMDCVGILKLRNADVEKRIGTTKAKAKKKNSTKARLVFRCTLRKPDGSYFTLQVASTPILCTQPIGQPEISRMSVSEMCVNQTSDLFVIGKNFLKGTQILFQEIGADETDIKWQSEAEIEVEYFQQTHLICRVPEYPRKDIERPVLCQIVALSGGKVSDPQDFVYKPAMVMVKEENDMDTEPSGAGRTLPFGVSPVALQLNRLVERTQHYTTSSAVFQLPPGAVPSICTAPTLATPPRVVSSTPAQPLSSILKPATLSLPPSTHTLTLGPAGGEPKAAIPVQFVLPSHGLSPAVAVDSRQLGNPAGTQLVLMPAPAAVTSASSSSSSKLVPPVFTLTTMANTSLASSPLTKAGVAPSPALHSQVASTSTSATTTSTPMIVLVASPPTSLVAGSGPAASSTNITVPLSISPNLSSGQVESLLKQMLESSRPSSS